MNRLTVAVLATFVIILMGSGLLAYVFRDHAGTAVTTPTPSASPAGQIPAPAASEREARRGIPLLGELFGPDATGLSSPADLSSWEATSARIALRFALAAFLSSLLAFRWRRGGSVVRRNPYVAQTQILMAVVSGAMMMVVGDSAARAFGIFAAASLVRFRTNIRDPKEITVLLVCLGVGLAAGVGRWDMAVILTVFVLLSLVVLEYFEKYQVFRSMEVSVQTRDVDKANVILKRLFARHRVDYELLGLNRQDADEPLGKIVYLVNLDPMLSTSKLSDEILNGDPENIDSVEWDQKESKTYLYK
ncbi:MAG TPA: DUF4956 domain-containing protein [Pyrinomonadaceae bacterium]|jgi:uncharacterized membrane protein YhiD involved in acid resistance|nr:DUF4956 domain-containing protein [Pyrinomonadaceae bacterium]